MNLSFPIKIKNKEFLEKCAYGDGLCLTCGVWTFENAEAMANSVYCDQCENKTVAGLKYAEKVGKIVREND